MLNLFHTYYLSDLISYIAPLSYPALAVCDDICFTDKVTEVEKRSVNLLRSTQRGSQDLNTCRFDSKAHS